jgi:hypothetical protein
MIISNGKKSCHLTLEQSLEALRSGLVPCQRWVRPAWSLPPSGEEFRIIDNTILHTPTGLVLSRGGRGKCRLRGLWSFPDTDLGTEAAAIRIQKGELPLNPRMLVPVKLTSRLSKDFSLTRCGNLYQHETGFTWSMM